MHATRWTSPGDRGPSNVLCESFQSRYGYRGFDLRGAGFLREGEAGLRIGALAGEVADQEAYLGAVKPRGAAELQSALQQRLRHAAAAMFGAGGDVLDRPGAVLAGRAGKNERAARPQLLVLFAGKSATARGFRHRVGGRVIDALVP